MGHTYSSGDLTLWRGRFQAYSEADLRDVIAKGEGGQLAALAFGILVARGLEPVSEVRE